MTPTANFNMIADPHAAHVVYGCGRPITAIGLDVTNRVRSTPERLAAIEAIDTPVARAVHDVIVQFDRRRRMKYRDPAYPLGLAGPCAVAYLLRPALFQGRHMNVAIDLDSELTMGMTVVDCAGVTDRPANVLWMDQVDDGGVNALLIDGLKRL